MVPETWSLQDAKNRFSAVVAWFRPRILPINTAIAQGWGQLSREIGVAEIIPFEEQRFMSPLGKGIGEAIAEIEACPMTAFAVGAESLPGKLSLQGCSRHCTLLGHSDGLVEGSSFRFVLQDRQNCRGIDHHQEGRPMAS